MTITDTLRIIVMLAWLKTLARTFPAIKALYTGKQAQYGDPARLVVAGFSIIIVAFNLRWFFPDTPIVTAFLLVLCAVWALYTDLAMKSYGRDAPKRD